METVVRFIAKDGTVFDTYEMCKDYEETLNPAPEMVKPKMWSLDGNPTDLPSCARLVYLGNYDTPLGANFIALCEQEMKDNDEYGRDEVSYEGIEPEDSGWFMWDEWTETYHYLDPDDIRLWQKVFSENEF